MKPEKHLIKEYKKTSNIYDIWAATKTDVPFYKKFAKKTGGPILELACGTGRLLFPLAEQGYKVVGVDISKEMLNVANEKIKKSKMLQKNVKLVKASMQDFDLKQKFNLIFISNSSFFYNNTNKNKLKVLNCIHRHLTKKGTCIIENYPFRELSWTRVVELEKQSPEKEIKIYTKLKKIDKKYEEKWKVILKNGVVEKCLLYYWPLNVTQMKNLIKKSKLRLIEIIGSKTQKKFFTSSSRDVYILKRK